MTFPRHQRSFGSKAMSGKQMRGQFNAWLSSCRDERLSMPAPSLANMYGLKVAEIEAAIAAERARRGIRA